MNEQRCKICFHPTKIILDPQLDTDYYYCTCCGFMSMDDKKVLSPELEQKRYLAHNHTLENKGYVDMLKAFVRESILPFHDDIKTALDFGSGPGLVLSMMLKEMGYEVDIYDIYFAPEPVYKNKTYDLITCTEVMEHLRNPLDTLDMLKDHVNPGGILAIMTVFHPVTFGKRKQPVEAVFKDWWYRRDRAHISFFGLETFWYIAGLLDLTILMSDGRNTISFRK
jgi:SAM-dependent methyltransferase